MGSKLPLVAIPGSELCPVKAFKSMASLLPASGRHPAFLVKNSNGKVKPLTYKTLQGRIKGLVARTGRDPTLYSSHSLRRGGCSFAFKSGVSTSLIQHHGDWLSDCYKNYLSFDFQETLSVSERMALKIISGSDG